MNTIVKDVDCNKKQKNTSLALINIKMKGINLLNIFNEMSYLTSSATSTSEIITVDHALNDEKSSQSVIVI